MLMDLNFNIGRQHENYGNDHINIDIINPLPGTKEISKFWIKYI
jgi:hypothetical protein